MARAPFQCLIIPFMIENNVPKFEIFKRSDMGIWQFISGGGEDDETPLEAAKRECFEEADIAFNTVFYELDSISTIPTEIYSEEYRKNWVNIVLLLKNINLHSNLQRTLLKFQMSIVNFNWLPMMKQCHY